MKEDLPLGAYPVEGFGLMDEKVNKEFEGLVPLFEAYILKPVEKNSKPLVEALANYSESVETALTELRAGHDSDKLVTSLVTYVQDLGSRRVAILNKLTQSESFKTVQFDVNEHPQQALDMDDDEEDDEQDGAHQAFDIKDWAMDMYEYFLQMDMNTLEAVSIEAYAEKPSTKRRERMMQLGRHALDVAKIGAGVVIGIAIAKRSKLL